MLAQITFWCHLGWSCTILAVFTTNLFTTEYRIIQQGDAATASWNSGENLGEKNLGSFFPFGLTSLQSGMMQRFSLNSNTYHLLQRYLWRYHHQNQSGEHNMLSNSQIYAKQLSWMLLETVWEEWEASQIHIRQVLSPSQSCCTAKWLTRKKNNQWRQWTCFTSGKMTKVLYFRNNLPVCVWNK